MEKTSLWNRVGGWFRVGGRGDGHRPPSPSSTALASQFAGAALPSPMTEVDDTIVPASRKIVARRETSGRERLEEGFTKVVELVESIQGHMRTQDERTQRMVETLGRMAENLSQLPEQSQVQIEFLGQIKQQLEEDAARSRQMEDNLTQLPALADAQRETIVTVGRQLDELRTAGDRSTNSLSSLGEAISGLERSTGTAADTLREIQRESSLREDQLTQLLRDQNRRLTLFAYAAFAMTAVVSLACIAAYLK